MSQLFGPRRRNRRIRNLLLVFGLPAFILVAYFGFIKDNGNSNNDDVESQESVEEPTPEVIEEAELIDNSPEGILTRDYKWMVQSEDTRQLQNLLEIGADGWYGEGTRTAHLAALEAAGLPNTGVPNIPTGCEIIIGGQLCGVAALEDADTALEALQAGLGDPDELPDFTDENSWTRSEASGEPVIPVNWVRYMLSLGTAIHHSDNALNAGVLITHISLFEDGIKIPRIS